MSVVIGVSLVLFLVLALIYFAVPKSQPVIYGLTLCLAAVWLMVQLFLSVRS